MSGLIRVQEPTKEVLNKIKIIETESYDHVIKRLLENFLDECDEKDHDKETTKMINDRINEVERGEVISSKDLREELFGKNSAVRKSVGKINK